MMYIYYSHYIGVLKPYIFYKLYILSWRRPEQGRRMGGQGQLASVNRQKGTH